MQKTQFITESQKLVNDLASIRDRAFSLADPTVGIWFADGFNAGGGNQITDGDLSGYGFAAVDLQNVFGALAQLLNYFGNVQPAQGNYLQLLNKVRSEV